MIIDDDVKLDFCDVMFVPKYSELTSRKDVNLNVRYKTLHSNQRIEGVPIISANMSSVSTFSMALALSANNMFCALHKHYTVNQLVDFFDNLTENEHNHIFYTLGLRDYNKFLNFIKAWGKAPKLICCDVAHGDLGIFHDFVRSIRELSKYSVIMAGNVVTPEGCKRIIDSGADIVKLGVGSGSGCKTRIIAASGYPQLSAIMECESVVHDNGALLCSDGGCNTPGDFSKAFGAGADFVMAGGIFAGHDECEGKIIDKKMEFYGMSSEYAMDKYNGGMDHYRASEGRYTMVDYKGKVKTTINMIKGGIASTGSYINALNLSEFHDKAHFVKANRMYNDVFVK